MTKIFLLLFVFGLLSCNSGDPKTMELSLPSSDTVAKDSVNNFITALENNSNKWDTILIGDLNNDKIADTAFILAPETIEEEMTCKDSVCNTLIVFSDKKFPVLMQDQALGGVLTNAGDLNNDGFCELSFVADWFTSNWASLNVYSLSANNWNLIGSGSIRRDVPVMGDELYLSYDKRIIKHKDYFEILENVMDEDANEKLVPKKVYFKK